MVDINALGQSIDSSWGRSSTPKTASYSVKMSMQDDKLIVLFSEIVNFAREREMIMVKRACSEESIKLINEVLKVVKSNYKKLSGQTLSTAEVSTDESVDIVGMNVHNPKRTALYRRKTVFEVS